MNRNLVINIISIGLCVLSLILSLMIDWFFLIPIICFLPFSFRSRNQNKMNFGKKTRENSVYQNFKSLDVKYCSRCGGEITKSIAKYCYHCGEKLNNI